jgi:prepilin-type N-terminal cleavage/methylation domain-containing protein
MNRSSSRAAFTLIEMITVMAVIVILVSMVLSVSSLVNKKGALQRTKGEIASIQLAVKNYETDNAGPPREEGVTEPLFEEGKPDDKGLDPRKHGAPNNPEQLKRYRESVLVLYKALTGDTNLDFKTSADETGKSYAADFFKAERIKFDDPKSSSRKVEYVIDPFGSCYGYSTAGLAQEEAYREQLRKNPKAERPSQTALAGYSPTCDIWSTAGSSVAEPTDADRVKWVKNW